MRPLLSATLLLSLSFIITIVSVRPNAAIASSKSDEASLVFYQRVYDETYEQYKATYDRMATSGDGHTYYAIQQVLGGTLSMFEATQDIRYLERALTWAETMVSKATIVDYQSNLNWGGVTQGLADEGVTSFLDEIQGSTELARLVRIIITDATLRASYESRATAIYEFLRDHVVDKRLFDRGALSWHYNYASNPERYFNDKNSLLVRVMTDLVLANSALNIDDRVQQDYLNIVTQLATGFKERLVVASGHSSCDTFGTYTGDALIWDCGLQPNSHGTIDTSHANREPLMAIDLYEAGIVIERSDIDGLALLLNEVIWDGSLSSPRFRNHIDGNNDPDLGRGPYELGGVYSGWVKLAKYNRETLTILDATLRAIADGVSNPSLDWMDNLYGRAALAGHLAKAVALSSQEPPSPSPTSTTPPTNQPPVITTDQDSYTVRVGETLSFPVTATDPDSSSLTLTISNLADFINAVFR